MTRLGSLLALVAVLLLTYVGIYFFLDTIYENRRHHAAVERATFFQLMSQERAATFLAAMQSFGTTQRIEVPPEPKLLNPIGWLAWAGKWEQPNRDILWHWSQKALRACKTQEGKCTTLNAFRIELGAADLRGADLGGRVIGEGDHRLELAGADLQNADLSYADLRSANLIRANLRIASLAFSDLRNANLQGANLTEVNLSGADLRGAEVSQEQIDSACALPRFPAILPDARTPPPACKEDD